MKWVRSLNIPRTGKDDINDHADIIERLVTALEQAQAKKEKKQDIPVPGGK